jgi:hypothetical protein
MLKPANLMRRLICTYVVTRAALLCAPQQSRGDVPRAIIFGAASGGSVYTIAPPKMAKEWWKEWYTLHELRSTGGNAQGVMPRQLPRFDEQDDQYGAVLSESNPFHLRWRLTPEHLWLTCPCAVLMGVQFVPTWRVPREWIYEPTLGANATSIETQWGPVSPPTPSRATTIVGRIAVALPDDAARGVEGTAEIFTVGRASNPVGWFDAFHEQWACANVAGIVKTTAAFGLDVIPKSNNEALVLVGYRGGPSNPHRVVVAQCRSHAVRTVNQEGGALDMSNLQWERRWRIADVLEVPFDDHFWAFTIGDEYVFVTRPGEVFQSKRTDSGRVVPQIELPGGAPPHVILQDVDHAQTYLFTGQHRIQLAEGLPAVECLIHLPPPAPGRPNAHDTVHKEIGNVQPRRAVDPSTALDVLSRCARTLRAK